jgi:hypothetical protein
MEESEHAEVPRVEGVHAHEPEVPARTTDRRARAHGTVVDRGAFDPDLPRREQEAEVERLVNTPLAEKRNHFIGLLRKLSLATREGANIPQIQEAQIPKVREGLEELFDQVINPVMQSMMPQAGDGDGWLAFEGAYEDGLDRLRQHIMAKTQRNPDRMYGGRRRPGPEALQRNQEMYERRMEERNIKDLKDRIDEIGTIEAETEEGRQRLAEMNREIENRLARIREDVRREHLGTGEVREVMEQLCSSQESREQVSEWLENELDSIVQAQMESSKKKVSAKHVQETYHFAKSKAMRLYINPKQSPTCKIDAEQMTNHFRSNWARPARPFKEAPQGSIFFLDPKMPDRASEEMRSFLMDEEEIEKVIRSRNDLSANGTDGVWLPDPEDGRRSGREIH